MLVFEGFSPRRVKTCCMSKAVLPPPWPPPTPARLSFLSPTLSKSWCGVHEQTNNERMNERTNEQWNRIGWTTDARQSSSLTACCLLVKNQERPFHRDSHG